MIWEGDFICFLLKTKNALFCKRFLISGELGSINSFEQRKQTHFNIFLTKLKN
jgi:hypothetical protein